MQHAAAMASIRRHYNRKEINWASGQITSRSDKSSVIEAEGWPNHAQPPEARRFFLSSSHTST